MSLGFKNDGLKVNEYVYDFSTDGGAVSTISLSGKSGEAGLPDGSVVHRVHARALTACTSGGAATIAWGNTADPDGYSGTAIAVASFTANATFNEASGAGALLWDNTNDAGLDYAVTSTAGTQDFSLTIGTAALTAGKIVFQVEFTRPAG
jgi:hypothetical protein